ncbi:hypothetical protein F5141DRAFT_1126650 [Pisolithus sp. B1]|nr:hypothetical protein F5141DRAFT_1126650 [Pisolithus sp. B1]
MYMRIHQNVSQTVSGITFLIILQCSAAAARCHSLSLLSVSVSKNTSFAFADNTLGFLSTEIGISLRSRLDRTWRRK